MRLVLLDTNSLFLPVRVRFPLEAEVARLRPGATLGVPSSVRGELDRLVDRHAPLAIAARSLAEKFPEFPTLGRGDEAVLRAARRYHAWVVTADRKLRDRLRAVGVTVLAPRDRHRLERFSPREPPARPTPVGPSRHG